MEALYPNDRSSRPMSEAIIRLVAAIRIPKGGEDISQGQGRARQGGPRPLESWTFFDTRALTGREDHAERPIALKPSPKVRRRAFIERGPLDLHDLSDAALPAPAPGRGTDFGGGFPVAAAGLSGPAWPPANVQARPPARLGGGGSDTGRRPGRRARWPRRRWSSP